jgi:hypothetical protein
MVSRRSCWPGPASRFPGRVSVGRDERVGIGLGEVATVEQAPDRIPIAALLLATGYLLGTCGSDGTADNASEPAGNAAAPAVYADDLADLVLRALERGSGY